MKRSRVVGTASLETPHPYNPSNVHLVRRKLRVPGATSLELVFDPKCSTDGPEETVTLSTPGGDVAGAVGLHGSRKNGTWPTRKIVVPGDTVYVTMRARP